MTKNIETILDENGFELTVAYCYEKTPSFCAEPGNADTYVEPSVYTELLSVELVIKGTGIELLPLLNEKQKKYIINQLNYES